MKCNVFKIITISAIIAVMVFLCGGCGEKPKSSLDDVQPSSDIDKSFTEDFTSKLVELDYKQIYDEKNDKINVVSNSPIKGVSTFTEEQFSISYYSLKDLLPEDIGYLVALMEETAWYEYSPFDTGIRISIFSNCIAKDNNAGNDKKVGVNFDYTYYSFEYKTNMQDDEYGDRYTYNKFAAQEFDDIDIFPRYDIVKKYTGNGVDPFNQSNLENWQYEQLTILFNSYSEERIHFNGEPEVYEEIPYFASLDNPEVHTLEGIVAIKDGRYIFELNEPYTFYDSSEEKNVTLNEVYFFDEKNYTIEDSGYKIEELVHEGMPLKISGMIINYRGCGEYFWGIDFYKW